MGDTGLSDNQRLLVLKAEFDAFKEMHEKSLKRVHERVDALEAKTDVINEKLDALLLNINRLKYVGIGGLSFYILDKFGGIGAIKTVLGLMV